MSENFVQVDPKNRYLHYEKNHFLKNKYKIAKSIEKIASTRRPVIVSSGGASEKDLDDVVSYFANRDIPLCINHCVSLYPSEDDQLHLDQIDYLKNRYPNNVIGFSSHEYHDWSSSMLMSYAKGARSWERHIDIEWPDHKVQKYCSINRKKYQLYGFLQL